MIAIVVECNNCGKTIDKKYPWIRAFSLDDFRNFYEAQGFSDNYMNIDVCPDCKEKIEDISFRE